MADTRTVEVRYFAAAAEAAGRAKEDLHLTAAATVADLHDVLADKYGAAMTRILGVAAFLVGDELTRDRGQLLGDRVDVLPPFAGG
ncbi:MoaD/ThiS family protein [Skermania sp. ID1734]|uniref:MoaD/ThiS family protein n=1 Tax=Skermania sp. ID1734 TaxID=2597516 RepID=UPI00210271FF|nr:MoaD/ThiS family protein [Skermania sp. ID1734]